MPTILAIETSSEQASCALLLGDSVLHLATSGVRTHSLSMLPMVQQLLQQAGIALSDCDAIAYGCGPGSFTGVRTACGIAQGLAYGAALPVVPVITLAAMALACRQRSGAGAVATEVLAVLDARMGEVYWAQYAFDAAGDCKILVAPTLSAPTEVPQPVAAFACGNGLAAYAEAFEGWADSMQPGSMLPDIMPHAIEIGQLARSAFRAGNVLPAAQAQPLYLRNKIAYTSAERLAMRAAQDGS